MVAYFCDRCSVTCFAIVSGGNPCSTQPRALRDLLRDGSRIWCWVPVSAFRFRVNFIDIQCCNRGRPTLGSRTPCTAHRFHHRCCGSVHWRQHGVPRREAQRHASQSLTVRAEPATSDELRKALRRTPTLARWPGAMIARELLTAAGVVCNGSTLHGAKLCVGFRLMPRGAGAGQPATRTVPPGADDSARECITVRQARWVD